MTQSQPIESSQRTNRTPSAPRSPNPNEHMSGESSVAKNYMLAKSAQESEAGENVERGEQHLLDEDINKCFSKGTRVALLSQISNNLATNVPPQVDAFLRNYLNNNILHAHLKSSSSSIPNLQHQLYLKMKDDPQAHNADFTGESSAKRKKMFDKGKSAMSDSSSKTTKGSSQTKLSIQESQKEYDPWSEDQETNDNEIHAFPFPENDLEELMSRWIGKVIKRFKLEARYAVHRQKSTWAKIYYIRGQLEKRSDPDEVYSDQKIVEKYLNKNVIEDLYLMCLNGKINYQENKILKSLVVVIRSGVLWERVHDYQLGLEIYQLKVNLTAPTLMVRGIENHSLYLIIAIPFVGLVYENSKKERRVINIDEIPKLCDAIFNRVLENVRKINLDVKHGFKDPPLSKEDADLMKFFEEHIQDRLKHRVQMRR
ncbi:hypothetical protein Tco_0706889 [Tanacetum coccineum]|uniref:Uncharacterized protein n=1 Tax=Tanacetum coccineum TaxID=301880 RepID=A0ABQ4YAA0_9ASTR